jgi:hypothetical protein
MSRKREFSIEPIWQWAFALLLLPLFWYSNQLAEGGSHHYFSGPLFLFVQQGVSLSPWLLLAINILLVYLSGILGNAIFKGLRLLPRKNNLVLIFFLLTFLQFPVLKQLNPIVLVLPLLLYALYLFFRTTEQEFHKRDVVSISLVLSIASMLYLPLVVMILFIPIGISLLSSINVRLLFISVFSFFIPYLYLGVYYFLYDDIVHLMTVFQQFNGIFQNNWLTGYTIAQLSSLLFLLILNLFSWSLIGRAYNSYLIQSRRLLVFLMVFSLFFVLISLFYALSAELNMLFIAIPIAVFLSMGVMEINDRRYFWFLSFVMVLLPISQLFIWHY